MSKVYYSQADSRWANLPYTSTGNKSQTIKSSGCGPTSAAMVISSIKKVVLPKEMCDLYVKNGFRTANSGTSWGSMQWTAKNYDIEFARPKSTYETADYLKKGWYVVAACGKGLWTSSGHFIAIMGINESNEFEVYDPYYYTGKFDTSSRKGKVRVEGNKVWCNVDVFKANSNAQGFFAFKAEGVEYDPIPTPSGETKSGYVNTNIDPLNVRTGPGTNYSVVGVLPKGTNITIYDEKDSFCKIGDNKWVSAQYVAYGNSNKNSTKKTMTVTAKKGENVRSGPGTSYSIVTAYSYGTKVQVSEITNGWAKVSKGYMSVQYLK